jgi:hypothetical protein
MPEPQSAAAAAAIADARIPPGEDYEEIREQVRMKKNIVSMKMVSSLTQSFFVGL